MAEFRPVEILRVLRKHDAQFLVVGGVAGSLAGSPLSTTDLDLVYLSDELNNRRLAAGLREIHAIYKDPAGRLIEPTAERLGMYRVNLLRTDLGDLDLLRSIGHDLDYQQLVHRCIGYQIDELQVRAIDLATLIEAKEVANRPKDLYALPFLKRLLDLQKDPD